jgi:hypothetical protein
LYSRRGSSVGLRLAFFRNGPLSACRLTCAASGQTRHVEAERPGQLLGLDTFYIGKLKGVGKVWQ